MPARAAWHNLSLSPHANRRRKRSSRPSFAFSFEDKEQIGKSEANSYVRLLERSTPTCQRMAQGGPGPAIAPGCFFRRVLAQAWDDKGRGDRWRQPQTGRPMISNKQKRMRLCSWLTHDVLCLLSDDILHDTFLAATRPRN